MSMFKLLKYSSMLFFLRKHRGKLFRSLAVLLFAFVTSLLYEDIRLFLAEQHPDTLIYALVGKIVIVYGALIFVLLQFRPDNSIETSGEARASALAEKSKHNPAAVSRPADRLDALANLDEHQQLRSRYDQVLAKGPASDQSSDRPSKNSSRS